MKAHHRHPHRRHLCVESFEPDVLFGAVAETGFDHRLLSGGRFRGQLDRVVLPNCCLDHGSYSLPCFAQGAAPAGSIIVGMTYSDSRAAWVNGFAVSGHHIQIYSERHPIDYRTAPNAPWYALQIPREVLQNNAVAMTGRELELPMHGCVNLRVSRASADRLRRAMASIIEFGNELDREEFSSTAATLESQLLTHVDAALRGGTSPIPSEIRQVERTRAIVRSVEGVLARRLAEPYRASQLLEETTVSERTVQRLVSGAYGLSPRRLFLVARLNQIRRELLKNESDSSTVESLAGKWGVTNVGRLASRYRAMFGENPHETLHRSRCDAAICTRRREFLPIEAQVPFDLQGTTETGRPRLRQPC